MVITLMLVQYHTAIKVFHERMVSVATGYGVQLSCRISGLRSQVSGLSFRSWPCQEPIVMTSGLYCSAKLEE